MKIGESRVGFGFRLAPFYFRSLCLRLIVDDLGVCVCGFFFFPWKLRMGSLYRLSSVTTKNGGNKESKLKSGKQLAAGGGDLP